MSFHKKGACKSKRPLGLGKINVEEANRDEDPKVSFLPPIV
jgi:hypothetical protein